MSDKDDKNKDRGRGKGDYVTPPLPPAAVLATPIAQAIRADPALPDTLRGVSGVLAQRGLVQVDGKPFTSTQVKHMLRKMREK